MSLGSSYTPGSSAPNQTTEIALLTEIAAGVGGGVTPSLFKNLGANATLNVKASAGKVFSATCLNAGATTAYFQLHNTATVPAGSAVPAFSFLVPPGSQIIVGTDFFTTAGCAFSTGIAFAFSTTAGTYTAGTAANQQTQIQFA